MNDHPIPHGNFFELEAARNRKYNALLYGGIAFFIATVILAKESGLVHLNYSPPNSID